MTLTCRMKHEKQLTLDNNTIEIFSNHLMKYKPLPGGYFREVCKRCGYVNLVKK